MARKTQPLPLANVGRHSLGRARDELAVLIAPKDRQQDEDCEALKLSISIPHHLGGEIEWCRQRAKAAPASSVSSSP